MSEARKDNILLGEKKKGNISTLLYICYIYVSKREKRLYRHAQSLWFWSSGSCAGPCDWPLMMLFHWTENSQQPCLIRAATTWALGTAPHGYSHALVLLWVCSGSFFFFPQDSEMHTFQRKKKSAIHFMILKQFQGLISPPLVPSSSAVSWTTLNNIFLWRKCFEWGHMRR